MKAAFSLTLGIMVGASCICQAQNIASQPVQVTVPAPTPYVITTQDANSRVWQRMDFQMSPSGEVITNTHSVTEICSGLNHLVNGQWVASSEKIDILHNGTAVATNGQCQATFPGDIFEGQIELVTPAPDFKHLKSRPLALAYFDGTNTVVIAELTNSIGIVVGNNQVVYPNAFNGVAADLRYFYTRSGFEQDVVIKQQPPTPESLGLCPDTARLQIMTEFFSVPPPAIQSTSLPVQAGLALTDESLDFGTMQMVPGRAFLMGQSAQDTGAMVSKHWVIVNGRQVLIEEVPVNAILEGLAALPLTAMNSNSNKNIHTATKHFQLPPQRLAAKNTAKAMMLTKADLPAKGFVLDYQTVTGTFTNYTFQCDSTYYISGTVNLYGANNFEGGAVLKYANGATLNVVYLAGFVPSVNFQTTSYRPVICTAKDDNSVGDTVSGSTGIPTNFYANPALSFNSISSTLSNLRIAYAQTALGIYASSSSVYNAQFVNCQNGISSVSANLNVRNALFANVNTNLLPGVSENMNLQNVTFSGSSCLMSASAFPLGASVIFTNCIFANVTNLLSGSVSFGGSYNGFYNSPTFGTAINGSSAYPFETVGGGSYYLANGSVFTNAGTTNIDSTLLASLKLKTTHPPISFTNVAFSTATNFSPQAARDTNSSFVSLGYHYDPLDYAFGGCAVNSNLTFNAGTAVGWFRTTSGWDHAGYGIHVADQQTASFLGTVTSPCYWVRLNAVQEQDSSAGFGPGGMEGWAASVATAPTIQLNFTKCFVLADNNGNIFRDDFGYLIVRATDCEFASDGLGYYGTSYCLTNCLFDRSYLLMTASGDPSLQVILRNCTMHGAYIYITKESSAPYWYSSIRDCAFDGSTFTPVDTNNFDCDYNAFLLGNARLPIAGSHDVTVTNSFNWQSSWFGNYYQATGGPLVDKGETNANLLGLYQFTTQTNQVKEGNSIVDIGYHYVATDANGNPLDSNGDGIPDYWEDANGNGLVDPGEIGWDIVGDLNLQVLITRPKSNSGLP